MNILYVISNVVMLISGAALLYVLIKVHQNMAMSAIDPKGAQYTKDSDPTLANNFVLTVMSCGGIAEMTIFVSAASEDASLLFLTIPPLLFMVWRTANLLCYSYTLSLRRKSDKERLMGRRESARALINRNNKYVKFYNTSIVALSHTGIGLAIAYILIAARNLLV